MLRNLIFILVLFCFDWIYGYKQCQDCVFINSCENAKSLENEANDPDVVEKFINSLCGFATLNGNSKAKICCSYFTDILNRNADNKDDIENHKNLELLPNNCGETSGEDRIVGGTNANMYQYPWMALLSFRRQDNKPAFMCGGTIINSRYILTAGHCFSNRRHKLVGVRVGEYDISTKKDCQDEFGCEEHLQSLYVEKIIIHENYSINTNDIALLRTRTRINFEFRNVKPICLPVFEELRNKNLGGVRVNVAGWGYMTSNTFRQPAVLQTVNIPVWEQTDCMTYLRSDSKYLKVLESVKVLCAGEPKKDSCNGDSGGPLMAVDEYLDMERMVQFGVISKGPVQCGLSGPGIYTDLTKYVYWILENIKE